MSGAVGRLQSESQVLERLWVSSVDNRGATGRSAGPSWWVALSDIHSRQGNDPAEGVGGLMSHGSQPHLLHIWVLVSDDRSSVREDVIKQTQIIPSQMEV